MIVSMLENHWLLGHVGDYVGDYIGRRCGYSRVLTAMRCHDHYSINWHSTLIASNSYPTWLIYDFFIVVSFAHCCVYKTFFNRFYSAMAMAQHFLINSQNSQGCIYCVYTFGAVVCRFFSFYCIPLF